MGVVKTLQGGVSEQDRTDLPEAVPGAAIPSRTRQMLPPKGACWYCDKPLDNVRRFCGKECSLAFDEEEAYKS